MRVGEPILGLLFTRFSRGGAFTLRGGLFSFEIGVLAASRQHRLHLEHVAAASIRAHLEGHLKELADAGRQRLGNLQRRLHLCLSLQEQQAETEAEELGERVLQVLFGAQHQRLHDRLHALLVAGTNEDQAEGKGGKRHDVHGNGLVRDDGDEELLHLFFLATSVRETKAHDSTYAH